MIQVDSITIEEFRGIRNLTLSFNGKTFAICGPNGTGKSGVVDALEFALTGNVSRLSGEGKGEVSVKHHGPHVDHRNNPEKARVKVTLTVPSLGKTVTIERSVKNPAVVQLTPDEPAVRAILDQVAEHPEIGLSRRELIRYVLATPGDRAHEVQALLHLDRVEQVRAGLQKIANGAERQLPLLESNAKTATENLQRALGISELNTEKSLAAVNAQRTILGLQTLVELTLTTSLKDGLAAHIAAKPQPIPKAQAQADIQAAGDALDEISGVAFTAKVLDVMADVTALAAESASASGVAAENFYVTGLALVEAESCPFCDTAWDLNALRARVQTKIDRLKEFSLKRKAIEDKVVSLTAALWEVRAAVETLVRYGALATPPVAMQAATDYAAGCHSASGCLTALLPLTDALMALKGLTGVPQLVREAIGELEKIVVALPEPNKQDAAREYLTVAQERLDVWREAKRHQKTGTEQAQHARQVSDIYAATSDKLLAGLYEEVQEDFAALYGFINRNDEVTFSAKLVPSMGKLGFDVDFYGRGFFPPGAYHSEGHQDGMGLCLYLALMRHLQGAGFTLAVLDDVLMSVDTGHRREVCELLKKEFPNTQFIITTHDPIWLRQMKTVRLIGGKNGVEFRTWSVDQGPTQWLDRDIWTEINEHLQQNDVRSAAGVLRHYLEYMAAELCDRLRAPVAYRSDGHYQLGELLPAAIAQLRTHYKSAKVIANGWNQKDVVEALAIRESEFGQLARATDVEKWPVNAAIHFNLWENLTKEDFTPVAKAYRELLVGFTCSSCNEYLHVSPDRENPESLRCDCGTTNINLAKKHS